MLYTTPNKLKPDSLVFWQSDPVRDGKFWRLDVFIVEARWFLKDRARKLAPTHQFIDGDKSHARHRAIVFRRGHDFTRKIDIERLREGLSKSRPTT